MKIIPFISKAADFLFVGGRNANIKLDEIEYPKGVLNKVRFMKQFFIVSVPFMIVFFSFIALWVGVITVEELKGLIGLSKNI